MAQPATEPADGPPGPGSVPLVALVSGVVPALTGVPPMAVPVARAQGGDATAADFRAIKHLASTGTTRAVIPLLQRFGRGFLKQVALPLTLFFHHLGTRSRTAAALKSS
ncbi:hypothetical protein GCM10010381_06900 [Streptomyces xantholiticus]|nr:hypothetical protein GCM10010381_06900 [Streptomyces xantholiticus]